MTTDGKGCENEPMAQDALREMGVYDGDMTTNVIYPATTPRDCRRTVHNVLFQSMRWMFWYEIAETLRYVGITRTSIDVAIGELLHEGTIERTTAGDGRFIYRVVV